MLRGYRSAIATLAGLAIVAIALFFLIRDLSTVDSAYRHSAANASIKYQRDTEAYVKESCITPAGLREDDCATKADEAAREGQRKEQDLGAQNITAWWTKIMGIAALIGMALSAVGVWLVKTTFDETRKANVIAQTNQRARLLVRVDMQSSPTAPRTVAIRSENIGFSPAFRSRFIIVAVGEIPKGPPVNAEWGHERVIKAGETCDLSQIKDFDINLFVAGVARYDTIFGGPKFSYFCFRFERSQISRKLFPVSHIPPSWPDDT